MTDEVLRLARHLVAGGAGRSARIALHSTRGFEANQIRAAADRTCLANSVYGLGILGNGAAIVVPLRVALGITRHAEPNYRRAIDLALGFARSWCGVADLPDLRLEAEDVLSPFGDSLALAAALAFVQFYTGALPSRPVLVTGSLDAQGSVVVVDAIDAKVATARAHRTAPGAEALVIVPSAARIDGCVGVSTFADAIAATFSEPIPRVRGDLLSSERIIELSRHEPDHIVASEMLGAIRLESLPAADRVRVLFEAGTRMRHAGRSDAARTAHEEARSALATHARALGGSAAERYEIEALATLLDAFAVDDAVDSIRERLSRPFLDLHNEVRCRGTLAQALAMRGRFIEAVSLRAENVALQDANESMRRELPWTYCALALDSARGGDAAGFDRWASALVSASEPGDATQWRYNTAALARGSVALGHASDVIAWVDGRSALHGALAATPIHGASELRHPEVSTMRALVRAARRVSEPRRAIELAERLPMPTASHDDLVAWLHGALRLEASLAWRDLGDTTHGEAIARDARDAMARLHANATAFHAGILDAEGVRLESVLDRIWY